MAELKVEANARNIYVEFEANDPRADQLAGSLKGRSIEFDDERVYGSVNKRWIMLLHERDAEQMRYEVDLINAPEKAGQKFATKEAGLPDYLVEIRRQIALGDEVERISELFVEIPLKDEAALEQLTTQLRNTGFNNYGLQSGQGTDGKDKVFVFLYSADDNDILHEAVRILNGIEKASQAPQNIEPLNKDLEIFETGLPDYIASSRHAENPGKLFVKINRADPRYTDLRVKLSPGQIAFGEEEDKDFPIVNYIYLFSDIPAIEDEFRRVVNAVNTEFQARLALITAPLVAENGKVPADIETHRLKIWKQDGNAPIGSSFVKFDFSVNKNDDRYVALMNKLHEKKIRFGICSDSFSGGHTYLYVLHEHETKAFEAVVAEVNALFPPAKAQVATEKDDSGLLKIETGSLPEDVSDYRRDLYRECMYDEGTAFVKFEPKDPRALLLRKAMGDAGIDYGFFESPEDPDENLQYLFLVYDDSFDLRILTEKVAEINGEKKAVSTGNITVRAGAAGSRGVELAKVDLKGVEIRGRVSGSKISATIDCSRAKKLEDVTKALTAMGAEVTGSPKLLTTDDPKVIEHALKNGAYMKPDADSKKLHAYCAVVGSGLRYL